MLITGASRGVGAATARAFAHRCGDRVAVHCRDSLDRARALVESLPGQGHVVVQGDIADLDAVERLVAEALSALGRIDVLVNNAAVFTHDPAGPDGGLGLDIARTSYANWVAAWRRVLDVNLLGTANVTHCVVRSMLAVAPPAAMPRGRIVTVGSRGAYRGEPTAPAYGASKAGVHALTQSLAVALAPHGVACVGIAPGFVETDMAAEALAGPGGDAIRAQSPFGRVARPDEVARAIVSLAEPDAEWASGSILDFNGASYLR